MAATKALDGVFHVDPPPTAKKLRELFYSIFYATDYTTHFYALGGPDFVVGPDAPAGPTQHPGRDRQGGHGRGGQGAQDAARRPRPHQDDRRPGRASQLGSARRREPGHRRVHAGKRSKPAGREAIEFAKFSLKVFYYIVLANSGYVKLITGDVYLHPHLQHGHGRRQQLHQLLRRQDPHHQPQRQGVHQVRSGPIPRRASPRASNPGPYLKFPYLKKVGWKGFVDGEDSGIYKATPLSRAATWPTRWPPPWPRSSTSGCTRRWAASRCTSHTSATHWARLVELLYAAERQVELATDPAIIRKEYRTLPTENATQGVGCVEAPRGTLTHHDATDERGILTRCEPGGGAPRTTTPPSACR